MKKELKKLWLNALRSGKYQQTQGALHDDVGYCCLGVLCDVRVGNWVYVEYRGNFNFEDHETDLILDGANLERLGPELGIGEYEDLLIEMNDEDEKSFNAIADWIEENVEISK